MNASPALLAASDARNFITAGNATFTVVSKKTGKRFTYRMRAPKLTKDGEPVAKEATPVRFLSVMTGPDNTSSYAFAGSVFDGAKFRASSKAKIAETAESVVGFKWVLENVLNGSKADAVEIWHSGHCGRCGRLLTTPESLTRGLGPECAGKVG